MLTYGMGYRMCAGSLLANRELYLVYMRLINSFSIVQADEFEWHPLLGNADPTSLVAMPKPYRAYFVPRAASVLEEAIKESRAREEKQGSLPTTTVKARH